MTAEEYDNLPQEVREIIDNSDEDRDPYHECARIQKTLEKVGWTCDYGLDGTIFDLRKHMG